MDYEDLVVEKKDGIVTITLNAPEKMNALTHKMQKSLPAAAEAIARDDEVRVVIVTGAGRAFCAGGDVEWLRSIAEGTQKKTRYERTRMLGQYWAEAFVHLDKPVIAAINGACVGAGFSLALSCDIRIASDKAKFGLGFIGIGLIPDCGMTYFLPRVIGTAKALELMFTGDIISAEEAKGLGIVNRVVAADDLLKTAQDLAARIAQQPPVAIELTKRVVYRNMIGDIAHHIDWETYGQQFCFRTRDFRESAAAFLEKRPRPQPTGE